MAASRRTRRSRAASAGISRATYLAGRLGTALREARLAAGWSQADVAARAGVSQPRVSEAERGRAASSSVERWAVLAAAVGTELAAFLQAVPGADPPRDHEHLKRLEAVIALAARGGWTARPELPIDPRARSRSVDVVLERASVREVAVVEVWDWFDDLGAAMRGLDGKVAAVAAGVGPGSAVRGLFVVRATARNRRLVGDLRHLVAARFPGRSDRWVAALGDPGAHMPDADGLVWSVADGRRLAAARV